MSPSLSEHYINRQPSAIRKAQILFQSRTDKHEVEVVNLAIGNKIKEAEIAVGGPLSTISMETLKAFKTFD